MIPTIVTNFHELPLLGPLTARQLRNLTFETRLQMLSVTCKSLVEQWKTVVVDFETTGLSKQDQIIEMCFLGLEDPDCEPYTKRLRPSCSINSHATAAHGLTMRDLHRQPILTEGLALTLQRQMENRPIVHWSNGLDPRIWKQTCIARTQYEFPLGMAWLNIMQEVALAETTEFTGRNPKRTISLKDACAQLGIQVDSNRQHSAYYDAYLTAKVIHTYADVLA